MNYSRLLLILLARRNIILIALTLTVLTTVVVSLLLPKSYKSTATLVLTYKGADPVTGMMLAPQQISNYMATQLDIIRSTKTALMVIDKLKLDQSEIVKTSYLESKTGLSLQDWLAGGLLKDLNIETSRDSSVIQINYVSTDAEFAAMVANAFANAYQEISIRLTVEPSQNAATYFTSQLNIFRDRLDAAQKKLSAYQHDKGIIDTDFRLDVETRRLNELSSQLVIAQAELLGTAEQDGSKRGSDAQSLRNAMISNLKINLSQAESKFSEISQKLGRNHPSYAGAKAEVDMLRSELNRHIKATAQDALKKEAEIRAALEEQKAKVLTLNRSRDELQLLTREVEGAQQAYNAAMQRLNQTTLEGQSNLSSVSILDTAKIPDKPDSPKLLLNVVLSLFLGTMLGIGSGLVAEMIDQRVRSPEDLTNILQAPVLGVVKWGASPQKGLPLFLPRLIQKINLLGQK
ncbi:chain length determinant protein EpsF [Nitrosomonas sp. JL21]|uniref:chain length determinant protein EpsF n=1 Tax=Nitrosomonas sp. JL21 TaxID=153949 RepID=UPI00136A2451|nr:chain length determinant protein EpsF [Nitrosomonas sp. JL21]MBL8496346.1 chain length determinant protein EpsF [Nitrosomonas sp.]MXS77380.1 chain length determinant protein EpsF [Nitrosomonas sp. JL21]